MLSKIFHYTKTGFIRSFVTTEYSPLEKKVDKIFETVIRPVLNTEGSDVFFHGIKDNYAVVTIDGMADTLEHDELDKLNKEILEVIQQDCPEIEGVRGKLLFEEDF